MPANQATQWMAPASPVFAGTPAPTGLQCPQHLDHKHNQLAPPCPKPYSAPEPTQPGNPAMSKKPKKHGPNKAKSIIAQPLFRCRQERPNKGKGSYRREAFQSRDWEASYFLAA